jgi:arginine exporter protein ArgO
MADFGLILIAVAGWGALNVAAQTVLDSPGGLLCFAGLVLIWIGTTRLADATREPAARSGGNAVRTGRIQATFKKCI